MNGTYRCLKPVNETTSSKADSVVTSTTITSKLRATTKILPTTMTTMTTTAETRNTTVLLLSGYEAEDSKLTFTENKSYYSRESLMAHF